MYALPAWGRREARSRGPSGRGRGFGTSRREQPGLRRPGPPESQRVGAGRSRARSTPAPSPQPAAAMYDPESGWSLSPFAGCGFLGFYYIGVTRCLSERAPHLLRHARKFFGASAGALHCAFFLSDPCWVGPGLRAGMGRALGAGLEAGPAGVNPGSPPNSCFLQCIFFCPVREP